MAERDTLFLRAIKHSWLWGGVGMLIRGGGFNIPLGLAFVGYGIYDLNKNKGTTGEVKTAEEVITFIPSVEDDS